jgi:hypothetical protein
LGDLTDQQLKELQHDYHGLPEMAAVVKASKKNGTKNGESYLLSPANNLEQKGKCEILVFGNAIFVPKFGVIRLAELVVHRGCRYLTMFHVQMCSGRLGGSSGGGSGGSGGGGGP